MSNIEVGLIGIAALIILMMLGTHLGVTMVIVGFAGYAVLGGLQGAIGNLYVIPFTQLNSYHFAVIPLFVLMGEFVGQGGIGKEAYDAARAWFGQLRGGLAIATIGACGLFAAVCGTSLAGTILMGRVAYPEMKRLGYSDKLSAGVTAVGGTLGILIPPSMGFVLIGILADLSIGKLFMAGILPGILVVIFYMITVVVWCRINPNLAPGIVSTTFKDKIRALWLIWPVVVLFFLIMGGIYGGIFTTTEAAGIGAFGAVVISLIKRQMTGKKFWQALMDSSRMTAMMVIIVIGAFSFNAFLAISTIPVVSGEFLASLPIPDIAIIIVIVIFYLICGMFFDIYAVLILTIPIMYPMVKVLGFDLIWYSVLMVRVVEVGFVSPPFGINLFGLAGIIKIPLSTIYRGVIPFCLCDLLNIAVLIAFPAISTFLPDVMM